MEDGFTSVQRTQYTVLIQSSSDLLRHLQASSIAAPEPWSVSGNQAEVSDPPGVHAHVLWGALVVELRKFHDNVVNPSTVARGYRSWAGLLHQAYNFDRINSKRTIMSGPRVFEGKLAIITGSSRSKSHLLIILPFHGRNHLALGPR